MSRNKGVETMIGSSNELERLRAAFAALADGSSVGDDPPSPERIWRAVRGELSTEETRELVELISKDPESAEAWRLAREAAVNAGEAAEVVPMPLTRRRPWLPAIAAAAVVTIGIAASLFWQDSQTRIPVYRDSSETAISSELPEGLAMAREAFLLRWTGGPEGSTYDLIVSTSDLRIVTRAERLTSPQHLVPREVLIDLPPDTPVLWQVEVTTLNGGHFASPTFVQRVE